MGKFDCNDSDVSGSGVTGSGIADSSSLLIHGIRCADVKAKDAQKGGRGGNSRQHSPDVPQSSDTVHDSTSSSAQTHEPFSANVPTALGELSRQVRGTMQSSSDVHISNVSPLPFGFCLDGEGETAAGAADTEGNAESVGDAAIVAAAMQAGLKNALDAQNLLGLVTVCRSTQHSPIVPQLFDLLHLSNSSRIHTHVLICAHVCVDPGGASQVRGSRQSSLDLHGSPTRLFFSCSSKENGVGRSEDCVMDTEGVSMDAEGSFVDNDAVSESSELPPPVLPLQTFFSSNIAFDTQYLFPSSSSGFEQH